MLFVPRPKARGREFRMDKALKIKDLHCHIMEPFSLCPVQDFVQPCVENAEQIGCILQACGLEGLAIPAITLYEEPDFGCNALSLYAKLLYPGKVYALAGIRRYPQREANRDMLLQARQLLAAGFDGFKMICKPNARRVLRFPIQDEIFGAFYEAAQKEQWPILFHVGDPASFWERRQVPQWAKENGWFYGEDTRVPSYEELYREVEAVLRQYPDLRITFAHFFFSSRNLLYASKLLDTYQNVCLDVTPGSEMYLDFAANPKEAGQFFKQYRERILFGTDNAAQSGAGAEHNIEACKEKVEKLRSFFETEAELTVEGKIIKGMGLDQKILQHLYHKNFDWFFHNLPPAPVDTQKAEKLVHDMVSQMKCETAEAAETKKMLLELGEIFKTGAKVR